MRYTIKLPKRFRIWRFEARLQQQKRWLQNYYIFGFYLTIRLWARDFYRVIVDEGEARINYHA